MPTHGGGMEIIMNKLSEYSRKNQIFYMLRHELKTVILCALVQILFCLGAYSNNIIRIIAGTVFIIAHFSAIYSNAAELGKYDNKSYSKLNFDIKWSVLWGLIISIISVISMVIFKLNWAYNAVDGIMSGPFGVILTLLFYIWQSPYLAFIINTPNYLPAVIIAISIILPIAASVCGYIAGKNEFVITNKLHNLMFDKKKNDA